MEAPRLRLLTAALAVAGWAAAAPVRADNACRTVNVYLSPTGVAATASREAIGPQIAVWVEDASGNFIDTLYVTRATGLLGIGNRPGVWNMKTDYRWPYGRRPAVLPVWAYKRGKTYPQVLMGGACDDNMSCGVDPQNSISRSDNDTTIAYHSAVSSPEYYFCAPSRVARTTQSGVVDVVSCASSAPTLCKGYFDKTQTSVYPPRGDIPPSRYAAGDDSVNLLSFAGLNDVAAVSGATPPLGQVLNPPITWSVPATLASGAYVLKVEVNQEGDFNASYQASGAYAAQVDPNPEWDTGYQWNGQPSVVYAVPFQIDSTVRVALTSDYAGYGDRPSASSAVPGVVTGTLHPPDGTISTSKGSGADRLGLVTDADGTWRVKVATAGCDGTCAAPPAPTLTLGQSTNASVLNVNLQVPASAPSGTIVQIRYSQGSPISDENFNTGVPVQSPPANPGALVTAQITGLLAQTQYYVAARTEAPCGAVSPVVTLQSLTTQATYATLSGCFVATAAYGSPLASQVGVLRGFRDRYLLSNPAGQLLTASYYAVSPPLASVIAEREGVRAVVRSLLTPVVALVQHLSL